MIGSPKASLLLIPLAVLGLLFLPIVPETETASVELRTAEVDNTGTLLGENSPGLEAPSGRSPEAPRPAGRAAAGTITLTVPKLGLKGVALPTGSTQAKLDREGLLRLGGTGLPWREGSNTFIAGHALGFPRTKVPYAFYELAKMMPGDEILIDSADGHRYTFRVYDRLTVEPDDFWVTYPVEGKTVVSLQTCTPVPSFENRLVVRGELVP
ncbi:MAG: sortase [Actinomycetota bacterium]|nr:sortase [Actinomycetota bacterium]